VKFRHRSLSRGMVVFIAAIAAAAGAAPAAALSATAASHAAPVQRHAGAPTASSVTATGDAAVDPSVAQTMAGFGASGDWWTIPVQYFPAAAQRRIANLLFTSKGIELSQYRYNIGGGGVGVDVPTGGESELGFADRAPQSFYVAPGIYNWSNDPGGTKFLRYAAADHVPDLVGNVVSAPPAFTTNGLSCGGELKPGSEQAFTDYLTTVITHIHDALHITLNYVSPMNEPDYTRGDCTQEGMEVPPAQRATVVQDLGKDLAAQAPYTRIIADESSDVGSQFLPEVSKWMSVPGTAQYVAALASHTYDFPSDATLQQARAVGEQYGKPLWTTEICCMVYNPGSMPTYGEQFDPTITGGLALAQIIDQDLTQANSAAFDWWVALSAASGCDVRQPSCMTTVNSVGWNDGLLNFDPNFATDHDYQVYPTKRFWALGNFSRFVRPGAQRHDVTGTPTGVDALAFQTGSQWEIVVINTTSASSSFGLTLPGNGQYRAAGSYQTSATANLAPAGNAGIHGSTATLSTPGQSITTFLIN
jgi:O-glycosyl hydrolase